MSAAPPESKAVMELYNSRSIEDLRPDVAANCRAFLELCKAGNLKVMIAGTVRDDAYQFDRYTKGYSKGKRPSFHAQGVGLAFDFCRNIPGHEYDDLNFFEECGKLGEAVGFEWGGRWTSFPDRPHLQWSGPKHDFKSSDIWAGRRPPLMPLYQPEEEPELTQAQFNEMFQKAQLAHEAALRANPAGAWSAEAWETAKKAGIFDGSAPQAPLTREQAAVVFQRLKLL